MTRATAHLLAAPVALLVVAALEAARLPTGLYAHDPAHVGRAAALAVGGALTFLWGPALYQVSLAGVAARPPGTAARAALCLALAAASAAIPYTTLVADAVFAGYAPLVALHVALFGFLAWAAFESTNPAADQAPGWRRHGPAAVALVGGLAAHVANGKVHWGAYPTLHVSVLQSQTLLLAGGLTGVLAGRPWLRRPAPWVVCGACLIVGPLVAWSGWAEPVRPHFLDHTVLGTGLLERAGAEPASPSVADASAAAPDEDAAARFARQSGLPPLPEGFHAQDYDVLWITGEATRFDRTSFGRPELETTPRLLEWARASGAFVFTRAYAPGCGTLQSLSSAHAMTWLTAAPVDVRKKVWLGRLRDEAQTAAETFAAAGYDTFWIGHNLRGHFTEDILGFDQGFAHRDLVVPEGKGTGEVDRAIADRAIARLRDRSDSPYFGWLFFASPHSPYGAHEPERPERTRLDRYHQELRFMDAQIARVLQALRDTGADRRTVVVFFGDHGEAFDDHGTRYHMRTVHAEVTHVPLLVRVPGMRGTRVEAPTSTSYVFPWLLQRGDPGMRAAAETRLRREVGPLLRATDGAVLTELVSHRTMRIRLTDSRHAALYDLKSKRLSIYDHRADPGETRDLAGARPELAEVARARVARYQATRQGLQRLKLAPPR